MLLFNGMNDEMLAIEVLFQNISCYCLTEGKEPEEDGTIQFQNISCYCLTFYGLNWEALSI